jgi:hypothetical protein
MTERFIVAVLKTVGGALNIFRGFKSLSCCHIWEECDNGSRRDWKSCVPSNHWGLRVQVSPLPFSFYNSLDIFLILYNIVFVG